MKQLPGNQRCTNRRVRAEPASCEQLQGGGTTVPWASSSATALNLPLPRSARCPAQLGPYPVTVLESPDPNENGRLETLNIFW